MDVGSEVILLVGVADDRVGEMMHVDDEIGDPCGLELRHHTVKQRLSVNRNQSLRDRVGYRLEPRAETSRENHRLHLQNLLNVKLSMGNSDLYVELVGQMLGQMLGAVDRTMLSAGTSEANLQMSELPLNETLHMIIHHVVDIVQFRLQEGHPG